MCIRDSYYFHREVEESNRYAHAFHVQEGTEVLLMGVNNEKVSNGKGSFLSNPPSQGKKNSID